MEAMPTTKCKIEFSKVLQNLCAKSKNKSDAFIYTHLVKTIAFILHSKVVFKKLIWLKLVAPKNTLHVLNPVIPRGNKMSNVLK